MSTALALPAPIFSVLAGLQAVLTDDPDERVVTDTLLDRVGLVAELDALVDGLADLLEHATSASTRRAYESDFAHFAGWPTPTLWPSCRRCRRPSRCTSPPSRTPCARPCCCVGCPRSPCAIVAPVMARPPRTSWSAARSRDCATSMVRGRPRSQRWSPRSSRRSAPHLHAAAEAPDLASEVMSGRNAHRLARVAAASRLRPRRDRALLLIGYAAALRRSELVGLDVGDLVEDGDGLRVFVQRSKTDQEGLGDFVGIAHGHPSDTCSATCSIRAWREWRVAMAAAAGGGADDLPGDSPAFRPVTRHGRLGTPTDPDVNARLTGQSVALIVKNAVGLLGDPQCFPAANYAGHSLRAGFATQAAAVGVPLDRIMRQTRHASVAVALRYIRQADVWQNNASAALGL